MTMLLDKALLCKGTVHDQPLPSAIDVVNMLEPMRDMLSDSHMRNPQEMVKTSFWFTTYL